MGWSSSSDCTALPFPFPSPVSWEVGSPVCPGDTFQTALLKDQGSPGLSSPWLSSQLHSCSDQGWEPKHSLTCSWLPGLLHVLTLSVGVHVGEALLLQKSFSNSSSILRNYALKSQSVYIVGRRRRLIFCFLTCIHLLNFLFLLKVIFVWGCPVMRQVNSCTCIYGNSISGHSFRTF